MDIVVIGGGFAGCAAAASLRTRGATVSILDAHASLGGRARSDTLDGVTIDVGAQLLATSYTRTLRLLSPGAPLTAAATDRARIALPASLAASAGRDAFVRDGTRVPLQLGSLRSLLAFGAISVREKLRLASHLLPLLARHHAQLDADAAHVPAALDAQNVRDFLATDAEARSIDVLAEPMLAAAYAMRASETSLAFFLALGHYGSDSDFVAARHGFSAALEGALRGATTIPRVTAESITRTAAGVEVRAVDGRTWAGHGVVIATDAHGAAALLAPLRGADDALVRWLATRELRASWTLALAIDHPLPQDAFGLFQDAAQDELVSACAFHGAKLGTSAPAGRDVLLAWPTPRAVEQFAGRPAADIVSAMRPEIERLAPEIADHVTRARLYRFDQGTPMPRPGFAEDRRLGRRLADEIDLPIALAGDYLTMPMIEGAVASGLRAAETLMSRLGAR